MTRNGPIVTVSALLFCLASLPAVVPRTTAQAAARPRVPAMIHTDRGPRQVQLVGREGSRVFFAFGEHSTAISAIEAHQITRLNMRLEYDRAQVRKLVAKQDWGNAGAVLAQVVYPVLPFVDVARNNGAPLAMRAGTYLMRAGAIKSRWGLTQEDRQRAVDEYRGAYALLSAVARAEGYGKAAEANVRCAICLIFMGQVEKARELLEGIGTPERTDDECGMYWLAMAYLRLAQQKSLQAMEDSVRSFVFETKDMDTFPEALMLSAHCYEKLGLWHRARDVYYELASLFPGLHWGQYAVDRLRHIMDEELAGSKESTQVQKVFFDIEEDMNALVNQLLGRAEKGGAAMTEQPDTNERKDQGQQTPEQN